MSEATAVAEKTSTEAGTAGAELGDTAADLTQEAGTGDQGASDSSAQQTENDSTESTTTETPATPAAAQDPEAQYQAWAQRWSRDQQALKDAASKTEEAVKTRAELATERGKILTDVPDLFEKILTERGGEPLTRAEAQLIVDRLQAHNLKALDAAKVELEEDITQRATEAGKREYTELATEVTEALFALVPAAQHGKYADAVRGKPASEWAAIAHEMAGPSSTHLAALTDALAKDLATELQDATDGPAFRTDFLAEAAKAKTPAALMKVFAAKAKEYGSTLPIPPPRGGNGTTTAAGPQNMRDVRAMHIGQHPSGKRLTTAEMRSYEAKNQAGQFPD